MEPRQPRPVRPPPACGAHHDSVATWCRGRAQSQTSPMGCGPRAAMIGRLRTGRNSHAFKASGWVPSRARSTERRGFVQVKRQNWTTDKTVWPNRVESKPVMIASGQAKLCRSHRDQPSARSSHTQDATPPKICCITFRCVGQLCASNSVRVPGSFEARGWNGRYYPRPSEMMPASEIYLESGTLLATGATTNRLNTRSRRSQSSSGWLTRPVCASRKIVKGSGIISQNFAKHRSDELPTSTTRLGL